MTTTPRVGATDWAAAQASPWIAHNEALRRIEAGAGRYAVADRVTAPPGSCADGANYIIIATATGDFAGKEGQIATAVGANASSGWLYTVLGTLHEGTVTYVQDEDAEYKWDGSAWTAYGGAGYAPGGTDVALADGGTGASLADPGADRVLFWDDSASAVTWLTMGTNLTITDTTLNASGGGSGGAWQLQWGPLQNEPPASNYATLDTRNSRAVLDFDDTTQEAAIFSGALPPDYAGGGITVSIFCALTTATSGTVGWDVSIERIDASSLDIDSDSFATAQTVTATTVPGTSGQILKLSVNIANGADMDSLAAGELFRIRVRRDVANDNASGDAELLRVLMVEQ